MPRARRLSMRPIAGETPTPQPATGIRLCRTTASRQGFTLLEMIVALAIFVGAAAILNELLHIGMVANSDHRLRSAALLHAESKLEEMAAGIEPVATSLEPQPFADAPGWQWTAEVSPTAIAGLFHVLLRVERVPDETVEIDADAVRFSLELERWIASPAASPSDDLTAPRNPQDESSLP